MVEQSIQPTVSGPLRPGPVGRTGRVLFGAFLAWYAWGFLQGWIQAVQSGHLSVDQQVYTAVVQKANFALYVLLLLALIALPVLDRKRRLSAGVALLAAVAAIDYLWFGDWWGLPMAVVISAIIAGALAFFALAHIVAGLTAHPG